MYSAASFLFLSWELCCLILEMLVKRRLHSCSCSGSADTCVTPKLKLCLQMYGPWLYLVVTVHFLLLAHASFHLVVAVHFLLLVHASFQLALILNIVLHVVLCFQCSSCCVTLD